MNVHVIFEDMYMLYMIHVFIMFIGDGIDKNHMICKNVVVIVTCHYCQGTRSLVASVCTHIRLKLV